MTEPDSKPTDFIRQRIENDLAAGHFEGRVHTRFPPEPNGYLHIGHAKSIVLNFGVAQEFGGKCNLRFDDTNPLKESTEYVDSIRNDVHWLGFDWQGREYYASDYFEALHGHAVTLIEKGLAYVDHSTPEEIRELRGTPTQPGRPSRYRDRSVAENLALFEQMRRGDLAEGTCVLRAKIDMAHPNITMRDPTIYRIRKAKHHRTGDRWCIYPLYDFTHCISDSAERITHSLCTLEFENNRPLYDWFLDQLGLYHPQQIEFSRLELTYTVMSKRKLLTLVQEGHVAGWDDPRMPTISGLRRRGYTPQSIRTFVERVGVTKFKGMTDLVVLENALREDLNRTAPRRMAVLDPLKVVIDTWPEGEVDELEAINNPEDASAGSRKVPFGKVLYIERDDFREDAPKKYFRLAPGQEVRLRYGYFVTCTEGVKDDRGEIVEVHCSHDPKTRGGQAPDNRKVKGTIHWVSAEHAVDAEVRVYDNLFVVPEPDPSDDFRAHLNAESLVVRRAKLEPSLKDACEGDRYQFERQGYFCVDRDSRPEALVFNRAVALKDSWAKIEKKS